MASSSSNGSPTKNGLFAGQKFWLSRQVPMRLQFEESMKVRGAIMVTNESDAEWRIVEDARKNLPTGEGYYSYKFITESIKNNRLVDPQIYSVGPKSAADRPVGSMKVTAKRTRRPFTHQDDQILYNWLEPFRQSGGAWKGNKIYEQLARKHPHHTYQSWRDRYLGVVVKYTNMTVTEDIDPFAISNNQNVPDLQDRSHKRRRLNGAEPANAQPRRTILTPPPLIASSHAAPPTRSHQAIDVRDSPGDQVRKQEKRENVRESSSDAATQNDADDFRRENQRTEGQTDGSLDDQSSHDSRNDHKLVSGTVKSAENTARLQTNAKLDVDKPRSTISQLQKFSLEEARELYRAVPHIHNVEPQNLDQSWEAMVQAKGHHTVAEWRLFYGTTILPEYMRRNNLATLEDLNDHVADILAEEQYKTEQKQKIKEEPVLKDITTTPNQTSSESDQLQEEPVAGLSQNCVSQYDGRQDHTNSHGEGDISADFREPSPAMNLQTIIKSIEIRQNGNLMAQENSISQHQPSEPQMTQTSVVFPKKRLFGRTLDNVAISSQLQNPKSSTDPMRVNEASLGTASATSALVSLTSESVSSSKPPPESDQRFSKSVTTSQEEMISHDATDQEKRETNGVDNLPDHGRTSPNHSNSPDVDLLWEGAGRGDYIPTSPALSDTGSEYVAFDTGPQRSQLWEPSQDETRDELVDHETEQESDDESSQDIYPPNQCTPGKQASPTPSRVGTTAPSRSQSRVDDLADEDFEIEARAETEGSPEFDFQGTTSIKVASRVETQNLFEQFVPDIEEDTTIFDLPPPDGGWEQFSDMEDESEDNIHASVEVADLDPPGQRVASLTSETDEVSAEPSDLGKPRPNTTSAEEILVISDHESKVTTSSDDLESPTPNRMIRVQQQKPWTHPVSNESGTTASSCRRASRMRDRDEDSTEESSNSSYDQPAIESWFSDQRRLYDTLHPRIVSRLASTSLQATVLNLSAATFTLRDMVAAFQRSEATRRAQFQVNTRIKKQYTDGPFRSKFMPKTKLTEEEARSLLPRDVLGVWTVEDDKNLLSQTIEGLEKVKRKHGGAAVRKRANFLRIRYGEEAVNASLTPKSKLGSARKIR